MTNSISSEDLEKMKNEIIKEIQESIYSVDSKTRKCFTCKKSWDCAVDFTCAFDCHDDFGCQKKVSV